MYIVHVCLYVCLLVCTGVSLFVCVCVFIVCSWHEKLVDKYECSFGHATNKIDDSILRTIGRYGSSVVAFCHEIGWMGCMMGWAWCGMDWRERMHD